jgi:hypothetical protein
MLGPSLTWYRGLAWHTDDGTLRQKFEEFGQVEEAVSDISHDASHQKNDRTAYTYSGRRKRP